MDTTAPAPAIVSLRKLHVDRVVVHTGDFSDSHNRTLADRAYAGRRVELNPFPAPAMIGQPTGPLVRV